MKSFVEERRHMVELQIEVRGVRDPKVLDVMGRIPRHLFVPKARRMQAYCDEPLPIGDGQTISQPYIVAYMTEALNLKSTDRVLEIGTGSGYQTAVLAEIVEEVMTVECIPSLSEGARRILDRLGYRNIRFHIGDGTFGWREFAPFDAIVVTAAPGRVPETLKEQLAERGRMIIPVGDFHQDLVLVKRRGRGFAEKILLPVRFVPLISSH